MTDDIIEVSFGDVGDGLNNTGGVHFEIGLMETLYRME